MRLHSVVCAALVLAPNIGGLRAQSASAAPSTRVGITGGLNSSTVGGGDAEGASRRTGFMVGAILVGSLGSGVSIEPEMLFTTKGAKFSDSEGAGSFKMNYIEVPLLLRYDATASGNMRPFVYAGPAIALRASCDLVGVTGGLTENISCDDLEAQGLKFKTVDYSAIVGGGLAFNLSGKMVSVGVRYNHGLGKIAEESDTKHRVISLTATLEFPWGK
jgi:hypothetical protein